MCSRDRRRRTVTIMRRGGAKNSEHRRAVEIAHGRHIGADAEAVWGWSSPAGKRRVHRRIALLQQMAGLAPGQDVLEIGCGAGLFTERLAESGVALVALDVSPDLLGAARTRLRGHRNVMLMRGDIETLPFSSRCFDAVVGSSVLHHLSVASSLQEIWRVLKPGGRIAFAEPNMLNPQIMIQKNVPFIKRWAGDVPHETAFIRWRFERMLCQVGFSEMTIKPYDFLHPWTPRRIVPWMERMSLRLERVPGLREIAGSLIIGATRAL